MPLRISKSGSTIATFKILNFDSDAQTFLTAAGITNSTQQNAINKLTIDLKYYGLWTKMKALYPVVGGTSAAHAVNLRTPGTYNLSFTAGMTHSSTGMVSDGTSGYADTGFNPSTNMTVNSNSFSVYSRTSRADAIARVLGARVTSPGSYTIGLDLKISVNSVRAFNNNSTSFTTTNTDSKGFYQLIRTGANATAIFKNTTKTANTAASTGLPTVNLYFCAYNNIGTAQSFETVEVAFASIGDGLTDQDAINFYDIVQRYQINLGRQV